MITGIVNRLLYRYDSSSYIIKNRARFILYLILTLMIIVPIIMLYHSYVHLSNQAYDYKVQIAIIGPEFIVFLMTFFILIILIRGYIALAGNLLLIICQSAIWAVIFLFDSDLITRTDTVVLIAATLTMMPVIIMSRKELFFIYSGINIALLFIFSYTYKDELNISKTAYRDFLSDNIFAFIFIGVVSFSIFIINTKALKRAENEIAERIKSEEERKTLQMQLNQSQKLESVGLLAGGVAHDFNNMLAAIQGFAELASENIEGENPVKEDIDEIIRTSKKARDLTQQLLAFAKTQPLDLKKININNIIKNFTGMLSRTIRENIVIHNNLCDNPGSIEGDPVQIEQIILNLSLNSQDAMPRGGTITIATSRVTIDDNFIQPYEKILPGQYILLSINDNGSGIDPDIIDRIFDPFFTTKNFGEGTGLGLSTVYGIVKQHGGMIHVQSEKGRGTNFRIYLPVKDDSTEDEITHSIELNQLKGDETVLVVDDNPEIRKLLSTILKKNGYTFLIADNPDQALKIVSSYEGTIHLLITDIILPEINGIELYNKISTILPEIRVIFISGYTANLIAHNGVLNENINFIQKPFSVYDFTKKIRDILDSEPQGNKRNEKTDS